MNALRIVARWSGANGRMMQARTGGGVTIESFDDPNGDGRMKLYGMRVRVPRFTRGNPQHGDPVSVVVSDPSDVQRWSDDDVDDPDGRGVWSASVVVTCADRGVVWRDQTIDGTSWEAPRDIREAYAVLQISGTGDPDATDPDTGEEAIVAEWYALCRRLRADGYRVRVSPY